jgi:hypothetical protein
MSDFLNQVQALVRRGEIHLTLHGFRELEADDIRLDEILGSIETAVVVEEYPAFAKGPCCSSTTTITEPFTFCGVSLTDRPHRPH